MDLKRTREALDHFEVASPETLDGQPGVFIAPLNLDESVEVFEAACEWVDLFEECQECGGFGFTWTPRTAISKSVKQPCPACEGRGFSLNQERVERRFAGSAMAMDAIKEMILAFLLEGEK